MKNLNKDRRRKIRYPVQWKGVLDIRFPDFSEVTDILIDNASTDGIEFCLDYIFIQRRHIVSTELRPDLTLRFETPDGQVRSRIEIRWYRWSVEKNAFDVGAEFIDISEPDRKTLDSAVSRLSAGQPGIWKKILSLLTLQQHMPPGRPTSNRRY